MLKILYVAGRWDPQDHNQASGTDYQFYHSLLRSGSHIEIVGPFQYDFSLIERFLMKVHSRFFKSRLLKYPVSYFFKSAYHVNQAIKRVDPDVIVAKYSAPLVFAKINKPLVYMCDSTAKWLRGKWKTHSDLAYFGMLVWETRVIKKCDRIFTFSEENASVLKDYYKVPQNKLLVFAIPASIPVEVIPSKIEHKDAFNPVKLLLVGRDYYRKGVDIAIEINQKLKQQGIPSELRVVGLEGEDTQDVKFMGFYNKNVAGELKAYIENYQWADFLLHPARFEAAGIVPSEAAAFGVPTLTNDTGGLATTVKDGVSGVVFPNDSPVDVYVDRIMDFVRSPDKYYQLVKSTRDRYDRELNWPMIDNKIFQIIQELASE